MIHHSVTINGIETNAVYSGQAVNGIFLPLLRKLKAMQEEKGKRLLVMLAAPPGAGKSTLLSFLERLSREENTGRLQTIGMDGFHRRQEYLLSHSAQRDGRTVSMVEIKGAPITFDLEKLREAVARIAAGEVCGWPVYDRMLHNPKENAVTVDGDIVLLEGNYLLLDEDGWRGLAAFADYTVFVSAEEALLRSRLIERRMKTGAEKSAAVRFVDFSDMPNARLCLRKSMPADLELSIGAEGDYTVTRGKI